MELYGYYRSSAAYRVRIALGLKGLSCTHHSVHLAKAEQQQSEYLEINSQGLVPTLVDGDLSFGQSLAIIEYLDEVYPETPLLPELAADRAKVRALAQLIAVDIHPLNNLRVLKYLVNELGASEDQKLTWYRHWILESFKALESQLAAQKERGLYCWGFKPTLADLCLVPQVYNARRFSCPLDDFPIICDIDRACNELPAFRQAQPEAQADAP